MKNQALIDKALATVLARGEIPGLVATAADQSGVIYSSAFGRRDIAGPARMTEDSVFRIASMTKAITGTAAMQMVEQGKLSLDQPAQEILPFLADTKVLTGFGTGGVPIMRPRNGEITLRNLLTHTAGFVYDTWNGNMARYTQLTSLPAARTGKLAALSAPLGFDPGERWEYGIGIDMVGRMVEVVSGLDLETYFQRHIFGPLGMADSTYVERSEWGNRLVPVHARAADGRMSILPSPPGPVTDREFFAGGGGLFCTAGDYLRFLRALMAGGELDGERILKPGTVALMGQNHMGDLNVLPMKTFNPPFSNDVDLFPGMPKKWGLTFLINTQDVPGRRSAGSLAWAGINNTYYWLDPTRAVAGVLMTQILPFADKPVLDALDAFEAAVYESLS
ncbi:serine hydrolase domain-containing protein [Rhodopila sp.]|uniref:serine hydrolase domain-containing protein n=1 Tax=Rhodopila sp. TaxID=2480087 RepID=UPI002C47D9E4|nr:serine hydrolase domain-containing protein [Rhodopila sp.]HVZ08576.1 serine hydrolase domain-containing protein [Rhodopila sp.]